MVESKPTPVWGKSLEIFARKCRQELSQELFNNHASHNITNFNFINNSHSFNNVSENCVLFRQWGISKHDKKLTAIGVWTGICHCNGSSSVITSDRFIRELISRTASPIAFRVSSLYYKPLFS